MGASQRRGAELEVNGKGGDRGEDGVESRGGEGEEGEGAEGIRGVGGWVGRREVSHADRQRLDTAEYIQFAARLTINGTIPGSITHGMTHPTSIWDVVLISSYRSLSQYYSERKDSACHVRGQSSVRLASWIDRDSGAACRDHVTCAIVALQRALWRVSCHLPHSLDRT